MIYVISAASVSHISTGLRIVSGLICYIEKDLMMSNFPLNYMNMLHQGTAKWTHCYL